MDNHISIEEKGLITYLFSITNMGTHFYYYTISAKDSYSKAVNVKDLITSKNFHKANIVIERESGLTKIKRNYELKFSEYTDKSTPKGTYYYGRIERTKDDSNYYHKSSGIIQNLAKAFGTNKGETGELSYDMAVFAFRFSANSMIVLMQQGYQKPGIGIFIDFFKKLTDNEGIIWEYELKVKPKKAKIIKTILNKKLKFCKIIQKKKKALPEEFGLEETITRMNLSDDYSIDFLVEIKKPGKDSKLVSVGDFLSSWFGITQSKEGLPTKDDELVASFSKIDFPQLLQTFRIEYFVDFDEDKNKTDYEEITELYQKEIIEIQQDILDGYDKLGKEICSSLIAKMNNEGE